MTTEQAIASSVLWKNDENMAVQLVAGAGSGKTSTMVENVIRGIKAGFDPSKFCVITFTRKAAKEMHERLAQKRVSPGFVGTMHSLGYSLLKGNSPDRLKIILHTEKILKEILYATFPHYQHIPAEILLQSNFLNPWQKDIVFSKYNRLKRKEKLIDLDDLILESSRLLVRSPKLFPYPYLMVDEFQDTSPDQIFFIKAMKVKKIFAVGDDWQSIYRFRGADVSISQNFSRYFPGSQRFFLSKNFRSQKKIVYLGNKCIRMSSAFIKKKLSAHHRAEDNPRCFIFCREMEPGDAWENYLESVKPDLENIVVLVRTNYLRLFIQKKTPEANVMTIHSSKGLEFEHVLVFGIARDIFPHKWNDRDEEIRLLYVAITRAKKRLDFLCWENEHSHSDFLPFLAGRCRINYLKVSSHARGRIV